MPRAAHEFKKKTAATDSINNNDKKYALCFLIFPGKVPVFIRDIIFSPIFTFIDLKFILIINVEDGEIMELVIYMERGRIGPPQEMEQGFQPEKEQRKFHR